ncbi:unnamed protein product [Fusarium equiseti]|uniref:Protein kinase domain-containing protein n=1 Tax=Fusarium equiseti TaxID=61235 RepID=A0A8J2IPK4_FUSEQ|nr:unnamed protein product [Fusarium equiseti]
MVDSFHLHVSFRKWIKSVHRAGINGRLAVQKYVPATQLKIYWTEESVRQIIRSIIPSFPVQFETITGQYLKVFSTLVFIDQPEHIGLFLKGRLGDNKLPLDGLPTTWNGVVDKFLVEQWQFCPWEFSIHGTDMHMKELHAQQILPVRYTKLPMTEQHDPTEVRIVELDREYCEFPPEVVFKIYKGSDRINLYDREADVYTRLMRLKPTGIANCYGSLAYTETNIRIIVLEYARMGSLVEFFESPPPMTTNDYRQLWERLLDLFEGLYVLHNIDENDSKSLTGIHQDIQPANILVFPGDTGSPYDVFFKLADFGLTEVVSVTGEGVTFPVNNEGNKMYSAPEAFSNGRIESGLRPYINSLADLWSLGAVLSDFMVWSIGGEPLRESYRTRRRDAVAKLPHLKGHGFQAYFHNGTDVLPEVVNFHEDILKNNKRDEDVFSPHMSQSILDFMLISSGKRLQANKAKMMATSRINDAQSSDKPPRPRTPETTYDRISYNLSPRNRSARTSTQVTVTPVVTVEEIYKEIKRRPVLGKLLPWSPSEAVMNFPGMQIARNKVNAREGRDQVCMIIFVIDDCDSLRKHSSSIAIAARVISYTVKVTDKNGMDLYFASDSVNPQDCRNSSTVEQKINKKRPVDGFCDMAKCLDDVLKDVRNNGMQPTSIYIFTDGIWGANDNWNGVKEVIHDAITSLVEARRKPRNLMFQFVQFGRDPAALELLKSFDDNCKRVENGVVFDIVDRKYWDSHVPKIIVGSLDRNNDDDES